MIEIKHVSKVYGKKDSAFTALDDVDFVIPNGSTVAIVGKSGSGKSTLMHVMSGLDRPSSGHILIDGKDIHSLKPKEMDEFRAKQMSFIFQSFFVEGNQSCFQNVVLPLEIAKVGRRLRKSMVRKALEQVDLGDKINARAKNLSGGQKQRLAVARAIVNKPKIIFADEPTGNLDSTTGEKIVDLLFSLHKSLGSTLIIVTHDSELANKCQVQITIKDGKIANMKAPSRAKASTTTRQKMPSTRARKVTK